MRRDSFFSFSWLSDINAGAIKGDAAAGFLVGIFVLAEGMAYAMIAGLPVQYGLYTAMVPTAIAAVLGSSRQLVSGPTTPISLLVLATISPYAAQGTPQYVHLVILLTLMVGVWQLILGAARLGALVSFISEAVMIGFTTGAAFGIACTQAKHVLGISIPSGESFIHSLIDLVRHIDRLNAYSSALGIFTLLLCVFFKVRYPKLPGLLFAVLLGAVASVLIGAKSHGVELIGPMPGHLPPFDLPGLNPAEIRRLVPGSVALAVIALVQASVISRSIAARTGRHIDGNREFVAQGVSNIFGSMFSCYVSTGSFTRSALNSEAGARTPLAALFSTLVPALVLLWLAPLASFLPVPVISGAILFVAYRLADFDGIRLLIRTRSPETIIMAATALSAVFFNLEFAVYVGVIMSLGLCLRNIANPLIVTAVPNTDDGVERWKETDSSAESEQGSEALGIRVIGPLFFGAVDHVSDKIMQILDNDRTVSKVVVLCDAIAYVDLAGVKMLDETVSKVRADGRDIYFTGVRPHMKTVLDKAGLTEKIGADHFLSASNKID